jgi:AcrR family transcriptional regulator
MTPVKRSREDTRLRLLEAARERFRAQGYEATTVRQIALDVDVDPALIIRYFGSKEALWAEVTLSNTDFDSVLAGERSELGARLAALVIAKNDYSQFETLLRSFGTPGVTAQAENDIHTYYVLPLSKYLTGKDAMGRAGLIISILNGVTLSFGVLRQRSLTSQKRKDLSGALAQTLQNLIDNEK